MTDNPNSKHINHINQLLHNKGIKQEDRIGVLTSLFEKRKSLAVEAATVVIDARFSDIMDAINAIDFTNKEISQEIFMLFGSKLTRYKLDQFYTPLTISEFITGMMIPGKAAVDPAGGTGDLLVHYNGNIHIWDVDEHALELCRFNYELNMKKNYQIKCGNSLIIDNDNGAAAAAAFDYVTMNPPFGSSTVITDDAILQHYELGVGRKKQELGILFLELGLKLLKPDGILFAIVPAGYVGNSTKPCMDLRGLLLRHRVIASIELPKQSFKRSGTGVNTYILVIQKKAPAPAPAPSTPYPIFISAIDNIGYELSKANTPIKYKIVRETGELQMQNGRPVVENDLVECADQLAHFAYDEHIPNIVHRADDADADTLVYDTVVSSSLHNLILDVKRYSRKYRSLISELKSTPACATINDLAKLIVKTTKIDSRKKYKYIDIGEISTPLYGSKELYGWELPSRAKYSLQKYDILVSKLEGTVSYCVILDDSDNYISTNGVSVIRPKNMNALYILFANITKKDFIVQHNAYLTGSIMASLSDSDIGDILMNTQIDVEMTKKMVEALTALNALRL